jgi:hypothetical protein
MFNAPGAWRLSITDMGLMSMPSGLFGVPPRDYALINSSYLSSSGRHNRRTSTISRTPNLSTSITLPHMQSGRSRVLGSLLYCKYEKAYTFLSFSYCEISDLFFNPILRYSCSFSTFTVKAASCTNPASNIS